MLESAYQAKLIKKLEKMFPGCVILKNNANLRTGIPDLTIFYGPHWVVLEVKREEDADHQPNQDWYIERLNYMWYAAFIYPENEKEVLREVQQALRPGRSALRSQSFAVPLDQIRSRQDDRSDENQDGRPKRNRATQARA